MIQAILQSLADLAKALSPTDAGRRHRMLRRARKLRRKALRAYRRGDVLGAYDLILEARQLRLDAPDGA